MAIGSHARLMASGTLNDNFYLLDRANVNIVVSCSYSSCIDNVHVRLARFTYLWHLKLGQVSKGRISRLVRVYSITHTRPYVKANTLYANHLSGKMINKSFHKESRSKELEIIYYFDTCSPLNI